MGSLASRIQLLAAAALFSTGGAVIKGTAFSSWQVAGFRSAIAAVAGGDPQAIATWFGDALPQGGFSTVGLNGPGEDGGFTIDSTGDGDCRVQTTVAPLGDMTFISVRYGAGCPAP